MPAVDFDPDSLFRLLSMRRVDSASFDGAVVAAGGADLRCVFFWGHDCYNCNIFKATALRQIESIKELGLTWFEANVYQDEALGRRFGLHGVPAFVFYRSGRRLGRISGWPGLGQFTGAVEGLRAGQP